MAAPREAITPWTVPIEGKETTQRSRLSKASPKISLIDKKMQNAPLIDIKITLIDKKDAKTLA